MAYEGGVLKCERVMCEKAIKQLPLQQVLDQYPCMIAMIPTEKKTAFLCALAVSWDRDNWEYVPEYLMEDTLKMMPYMVEKGYGSGDIEGGVWTREHVVNSYGQTVSYDKPYWENDNGEHVPGCVICGRQCETVYEGEEEWLFGLKMCNRCACEFVNEEFYDEEEEEEA